MKLITAGFLSLILALACVTPGFCDAKRPAFRVLLIDGQSSHDWRTTTPLIRQILEGTGRFDVTVATSPPAGSDMASFHPEFSGYDVVVSNYAGAPWPEQTRQDFIRYLAGGGGFVSVHSSNSAFAGWDAYRQIIGLGGWDSRGDGTDQNIHWLESKQRFVRVAPDGRTSVPKRREPFEIVVRDGTHPISRGLPPRFMQTHDEVFTRLRGPAQNLHVLATAFSNPRLGGSGRHEPVLLTVQYGNGRVFQTTLGHDERAMRGIAFQESLQRGTEWAASGEVTFPAIGEQELSNSTAFLRDPSAIKPDPELDLPDLAAPGWQPLFNGESLGGWIQRNGTATFRAEDGAIVGETAEGSPDSFLCTVDDYGDFELTFEVKCPSGLNSGVQIRSRSDSEYKNGRVHGPQVEIEQSPGESGYIYSEGTGRGWVTSPQSIKDSYINGGWNRFLVRAKGDRLQTWVNERPVADTRDPLSSGRGFIGLQIHEISREEGPYEIRWRDLRVRPL